MYFGRRLPARKHHVQTETLKDRKLPKFRVLVFDLGFRVLLFDLGFRVWASGRVWGSGFRV